MEYENTIKEPEIIARLNLLKEKVYQLRDRISPITISYPKNAESKPVKDSSPVMRLIDNLIEEVSDIKESIDIT